MLGLGLGSRVFHLGTELIRIRKNTRKASYSWLVPPPTSLTNLRVLSILFGILEDAEKSLYWLSGNVSMGKADYILYINDDQLQETLLASEISEE